VLVIVSTSTCLAQVRAERATGATWDRTYLSVVPGTSSVEQTKDGGFIMSALSRGLWVMKANPAGLPEWQKEYTPSGYSVCCDSATRRVMQTSDGGYVIVGTALSNGYATGYDGWLLKLDKRGSVEWSRTYGGPNDDSFASGRQTSDGGYIVAGNSLSFGSPYDASNGWVLRLDDQGRVLWQEVFPAQDIFSIDEMNDGGFLVAGAIGLSGQAVLWVSELEPEGSVAWQAAYALPQIVSTGPNLIFDGMARETSKGEIVVMAEASGAFVVSDATILKLDHQGSILWEKSYSGGGFTQPSSISEMSDGGFILAGRFSQANPSREVGGALVGLSGPFLLRLDFSGNLLWQSTYGGQNDFLVQAEQTKDGGIIAVGSNAGGDLERVLKLDSAGGIHGCPVGVPSNATLTGTSAIVANTTIASVNTNATGTSTDVTVTTPSILTVQNQCHLQNQQARDEDKHAIATPPLP